nr:cadherin-like domain-containing protein [Psychrobacter fjordensis]
MSFADVPAGLATNDIISMSEDSGTISGNVLDNDKTGLTVTTIQIAGTEYSVGTAVDITDVGTVQVDANGAYSFTPVEDYSGEVPDITYTVSDGTIIDTANLDIEVTAVADQPTTGSFELDPPALSLNIQTWSNAKNVNGQNLLANGGGGASKEALLDAIDYLRGNSDVLNSDGTSVNATGSGTTDSLVDSNLPEYDAVYISGYVFLEAGETYLYSGSGDDSAAIVIGDNVSSLHVNWKGTSTSGDGEFDVTDSGYYSFQFYAHNADGQGNYNFAVQNADGTEMKYYQNLSAIEDSLTDTSYILGDYDAGIDGSYDTGFYSVNRGYEGASTNSIELTGINLQATDTDGSEYLSFEMSGLPTGAILTFKDALDNQQSVTADANGTASYTPTEGDTGTSEYSDFTLIVGDTIASSLDVSLTVTSTEPSNNDSSSTTLDFEVEVTDSNNSDDTIIFNADSTSMNGGNGTDTLLIDVDGTSIDFSNFDSSVFESLEVIEMTGNGTQSLTNLTTSDVLEITNETVMTDKGLIINGDSADSVSLSGSDWTSTGTVNQGGNDYNVYSFNDTNGTHELLIQTDITQSIL